MKDKYERTFDALAWLALLLSLVVVSALVISHVLAQNEREDCQSNGGVYIGHECVEEAK